MNIFRRREWRIIKYGDVRILILRATFQRHQTHPRDGLDGLLLSLVARTITILSAPRRAAGLCLCFMEVSY